MPSCIGEVCSKLGLCAKPGLIELQPTVLVSVFRLYSIYFKASETILGRNSERIFPCLQTSLEFSLEYSFGFHVKQGLSLTASTVYQEKGFVYSILSENLPNLII